MATQRYAIERGGPKVLVISWTGNWKDFRVTFDGRLVGQIEGKANMLEGRSFKLPGKRKLEIWLETRLLNTGLVVLLDGEPVPGSLTDPVARVAGAAATIFFIAALYVAAGLVAEIFQWKWLKGLGAGWISAGVGMILAGLGLLVLRRVRVALMAAILFMLADAFAGMVLAAQAGALPSVEGLVIRLILLLPLLMGITSTGKGQGPSKPE